MAVFHVFVEGATNADSLGARLGISAAEVRARLAKGRFRVKANVDRETAERFVRDLTAAGARCAIDEAKPEFQSGLAAAFTSQAPAANLGALEQEGAALSLASVDGGEDPVASPPSRSFTPPPTSAEPTKARPKDVPLDLFVPPESQEQEMALELAEELPGRKTPPPASTPLPSAESAKPAPASQPMAAARASQPSMAPPARPSQSMMAPVRSSQSMARASQPSMTASTTLASRLGPLGEPRARFAAGVFLAVLLGFVPAHIVASIRESSTYGAIDTKVRVAQQMADTPEAYASLDRMRAEQQRNKDSARRNAALIAFAVWALAGAGLAFVWFRKIPWDR